MTDLPLPRSLPFHECATHARCCRKEVALTHSHTHSYTGHTASVGFTLSENNKLSTYVRNVHTRKTKSNQNLNTDILKKLKRKASRTKAIQSSETATSQQLQYAQRVKAVKRKIMAMSNIIIPVSGICLLTQIC